MITSYKVTDAISILSRTPVVLRALLDGLPDAWIHANEGKDTWSAFDVVGHLIHGERTDWIPRAKHILSGNAEPFEPFDRFAQLTESKGKSLDQLLDSFEALRMANIETLTQLNPRGDLLELKGVHPALGEVNLSQLLSTWVVHDLNHLAQISRVLAKLYQDETGPWRAYLSILK